MLPYIHAFDTKTGMPYVCDPDKKKPDEKIDNRWKMIVPPCPDFKKCLFPWNEGIKHPRLLEGFLLSIACICFLKYVNVLIYLNLSYVKGSASTWILPDTAGFL